VDYYCNPQYIGCEWIVNSPHLLAFKKNYKAKFLTNLILKK
jgi:hypothetical protein